MATIQDWNVLKQLSHVFVQNIKNIYIFDTKAVFIITNSDKLYSFGMNTNGCLGLGHSNEVKEPQIIILMSGKLVIRFCFGSHDCNVLALTKTGQIYSWGGNSFGQLANGNTINCFIPKIIKSLVNIKIVDIRSSLCHCLALTDSGKLFSWGHSSHGRLGIDNIANNIVISIPKHLLSLNDYKIIAIECGGFHSLALTDTGVVFVWGLNQTEELGVRNTTDTIIPTKMDLVNDIVIRKIKCGFGHSLLQTSDGYIYCFGHNGFGQIGDASNTHKSTAVKLNMPFKCDELVAIYNSNISIAKLENGLCYVWGECSDQSYSSPKVTNYKHINDVIIHYSKYHWNYDEISICLNTVISKRFIASFNDKKYSDFAFIIDGKTIYVQKQYLISVCKHFESMFSDNWNENFGNEVTITQYSYPVYHAFLKYLYTSYVEIETEYAFDLLDLANCYLEDDLKLKCAQIIKFEINIENVCTLYSSAVKYELNELKDNCLTFAHINYDSIVETPGFQQTEDAMFLKALMAKLRYKI